MGALDILNYILTVSMAVTLICAILAFAMGATVRFGLESLVEEYFDPSEKNLKLSSLVGVGHESIVPTKEELPSELDLGNWSRTLGSVIIMLATLMVIYSVFGIIASLSKKMILVIILIILIVIALFGEFILLSHTISLSSGLNTGAKQQLLHLLRTQYRAEANTNNVFTFAMNSIMLMGECCGIYGPADFHGLNMTVVYSVAEGGTLNFPVDYPPACCRSSYIKKGFDSVIGCAKKGILSNFNHKGCYETVYSYIADNYGSLIIGLSCFVIIWELLQIMLALGLIFRTRDVEKETLRQTLERERVEEERAAAAAASVFVPYAKVSSYSSMDVNRIKSTEIW
ncbi:tetraspanin-18 [Aplysia californica]|uniref:Tetraspanin-18 n=1 Tax=Aplysia californica TaxID=6500 RepID=A0ABM1A5B5_APLCA|nr:tetraspanin-18 [Aplysia californica]